MSNRILNIAAYQFAPLNDLVPLRNELATLCNEKHLRGTILVSAEGINIFVAGLRENIEALLARVRAVPGLESIEVKESFSAEQPFNRMLVKVKKEIIAFGVNEIDPRQYTSRRLDAAKLKQWLDEGRPVTLLDTRNDFEIESGTFDNAMAIGVDDFRDFPAAVDKLPDELKRQPVVTFCTGGIRCEKAAPYLEKAGFTDVYQLDGGILKYFEVAGGAHYHGDCFVFDKRVALNSALAPSGVVQCFACLAILTADEAASDKYAEGVSCPRCWRSADESMTDLIARRHAAIKKATDPLPGKLPYDNVRPISVPLRLDGYEVLDFFDAMHTHLSRDEWRAACVNDHVVCRGEIVLPGRIVHAGERLLHTIPAMQEPDVNADIRVIHEDEAIVVIDKPAPLPMHPCGRFNRNSLGYILDQVFYPLKLRPVHRLDADTSGIVVLAKTRDVARRLQTQFENDTIHKRYHARVKGWPTENAFECAAPISQDNQRHGSRAIDPAGAACLTRFKVIDRHADGTATLEVEPVTGRTHQIRIHLASLGFPIVGDAAYGSGTDSTGVDAIDVFSQSIADARLHLRATSIAFVHPLTQSAVQFHVAIER